MLLSKLRLALLGLLSAVALSSVAALDQRSSVGLAAGSPEATPSMQTVFLPSLVGLPPLVQQALEGLQQQNGPDFVAQITSVEVKYMTEAQLFDAIHGAWKHNNASECNTYIGPSGTVGHLYVAVMHGSFSYLDHAGAPPTNSYPVEVMMVHASDWHVDLSVPRDLPVNPITHTPETLTDASFSNPEMLGNPYLGPDGEPLCWGSLPG